ncbi:MAG: hypothetical protein IIW08_07340 [Clostridia bacterium]|nr:hypothetical protein [Clostridia bacterium]
MTLKGIRIRIRVLSPIVFILMAAFSGIESVLPPLAALSVHELSHILTAVILRAKIDEIELMPFGAAMRLYELWQISPGKLMLIALAGPMANLIFSGFLSLFLFFCPRFAPQISPFLFSGILIALVNLIPALPLDGGRFLSALLALRMKRTRAVRIGIWCGRIFGVFLIVSSVFSFIKTHSLPLTPILASVYLFASGEQEKRHAEGAAMRMLLLNEENDSPVKRAGLIVVKNHAPLLDAVNAVRPGEESLFAITDDEGEILTLLPLKKVLFALKKDASSTTDAFGNSDCNKIFQSSR